MNCKTDFTRHYDIYPEERIVLNSNREFISFSRHKNFRIYIHVGEIKLLGCILR